MEGRPGRSIDVSADELSAPMFRAHIGSVVRLDWNAEQVQLSISEVTELPTRRGFERFSVFFAGPADRALPQGTYTFEHDALGSLMLFVVPVVGSGAESIIYEACFNRPARTRLP